MVDVEEYGSPGFTFIAEREIEREDGIGVIAPADRQPKSHFSAVFIRRMFYRRGNCTRLTTQSRC